MVPPLAPWAIRCRLLSSDPDTVPEILVAYVSLAALRDKEKAYRTEAVFCWPAKYPLLVRT